MRLIECEGISCQVDPIYVMRDARTNSEAFVENDDTPMDVDIFAQWCGQAIGLSLPPQPGTRLRTDLQLDDLELFTLVTKFNQMTSSSARVLPDVFEHVDSIRDLYLYYLTIGSMPRD